MKKKLLNPARRLDNMLDSALKLRVILVEIPLDWILELLQTTQWFVQLLQVTKNIVKQPTMECHMADSVVVHIKYLPIDLFWKFDVYHENMTSAWFRIVRGNVVSTQIENLNLPNKESQRQQKKSPKFHKYKLWFFIHCYISMQYNSMYTLIMWDTASIYYFYVFCLFVSLNLFFK